MSGEQSLGGDCPGGNFIGGNYHGDRCLGGNYSGVIAQGAKDRGVIVLEGISWEQLSGGSCPRGECLDTPVWMFILLSTRSNYRTQNTSVIYSSYFSIFLKKILGNSFDTDILRQKENSFNWRILLDLKYLISLRSVVCLLHVSLFLLPLL